MNGSAAGQVYRERASRAWKSQSLHPKQGPEIFSRPTHPVLADKTEPFGGAGSRLGSTHTHTYKHTRCEKTSRSAVGAFGPLPPPAFMLNSPDMMASLLVSNSTIIFYQPRAVPHLVEIPCAAAEAA
jgi:hypothetical protein